MVHVWDANPHVGRLAQTYRGHGIDAQFLFPGIFQISLADFSSRFLSGIVYSVVIYIDDGFIKRTYFLHTGVASRNPVIWYHIRRYCISL